MTRLVRHVTQPDNLCWAWVKTKFLYSQNGMLHNSLEVSEFEIDLTSNLNKIAQDIKDGIYVLSPLVPLAHPKSKEKDSHRIRQAFEISVRDQVTWIAIVNILGPSLEKEMPLWSYGNRLYRQLFFTGVEETKQLNFGHFRHSSGKLYRTFTQSWPLYRRHILFTARRMMGDNIILDRREREINDEEELNDRVPYLRKGWWKNCYTEAYWAAIDFKKFYPSISQNTVIANMCHYSDYESREVRELVEPLFRFPLLLSAWDGVNLELVGLKAQQEFVEGLPTGLFVSGFLANVAMLEIDKRVNRGLEKRQIAHFRYVDDHTVLAPTFEALNQWINEYLRLVEELKLGAEVNEQKTEPETLLTYRQEIDKGTGDLAGFKEKAMKSSRINPRLPAPLLTKTLTKVSLIACIQTELQTSEEIDALLVDVEHLLLTEFPEEELRPVTRMSFAMSQLCKIVPKRYLRSEETWDIESKISNLIGCLKGRKALTDEKLIKLCEERNKVIDKQFERHFSMIKMTLERYPERPRLWANAVRFCLSTGYSSGLRNLFDLVAKCKEIHPLSVGYLKSFILQSINMYYVSAIRTVISPERPFCTRSAALRFAISCFDLQPLVREIEEHSCEVKYFTECCNAFQLLCTCVASIKRAHYHLEEAYFFIYQQGMNLALHRISEQKLVKGSNKEIERAAHWLIDRELTPFVATYPSYYWRKLCSELNPKESSDSILLQKWPKHLTKKFKKYYLDQVPLALSSRHGWYADVFEGSDVQIKTCEELFSSQLPSTEDAPEGYITLKEWVVFLRKLDPCDPRRSEWTSLEIVRQITEYKTTTSNMSDMEGITEASIQINPYNILLPLSWMVEEPKAPDYYTWESWENHLNKPLAKIQLRHGIAIEDERYFPVWENFQCPDKWFDIYASGLILLGLLRLSYSMPASWNSTGQIRLWSRGMGRILSELPCSSWTLAILQALIMPRNRETTLLKALQQNQYCTDDDTINDPPEIDTMEVLGKFVILSQKKLEGYRISVLNHKPRQLVPLSLDQIGKSVFHAGIGEEIE